MSSSRIDSDYNWIKSATEGPHSQRTNALAIALSLTGVSEEDNPLNSTWPIEPGPVVDYSLVHSLIKLAHPVLTDRDHDRFDSLTLARKQYYKAHFHFQHAYRGLADTQAYERILKEQRDELLMHGEQREGAGKELEAQRRINARELHGHLEEVKRSMRWRNSVTIKLSEAKKNFVDSDLDRLVFICRHLYLQHNRVSGT